MFSAPRKSFISSVWRGYFWLGDHAYHNQSSRLLGFQYHRKACPLEWLGGVALTVGFPLQFYFRFLRNIKAKYPDPEFESEYAFYNDRVITISNATRVEIYWQDVVNYLVIGHFLVVSVRNRAEMYFIQLKGLSATQRVIVFSNLKNARPTRPNT